jgi:predicted dehydrogenase
MVQAKSCKMKNEIAVVGAGRWGRNYLRTFNEIGCNIRWLCSTRDDAMRAAMLEAKVKAKATKNYDEVLKDNDVSAVAIATPSSTHYRLAKQALKSGKHVLVEKPIAFSSKDVEDLIMTAKQEKLVLMAGHQQIFNPGIRKMKEDMEKGIFGKINFMNFAHLNNGPVRTDMNALWDYFPHSISIMLYLLDEVPSIVSASGKSFLRNGIEDIATLDAVLPNKIFAASIGSWLYPVKRMEVTIAAEKLYACFDDCAQKDKLRYYSTVPKIGSGKAARAKGFKSIKIGDERPLTIEIMHFLECISKGKEPVNGGEEALKITRVLEAAEQSLRKNGTPVRVRA